jgi:hypothetical protein
VVGVCRGTTIYSQKKKMDMVSLEEEKRKGDQEVINVEGNEARRGG